MREFVTNPDPEMLDALVTEDGKDILAPDKPLTGKDWTAVVADLIGGKAFGMRYDMLWSDDPIVLPETQLAIFRQQDGDLKDLYLQPEGAALDLYQTNVAGCNLGRRLTETANEIYVVGALKTYEASFICRATLPDGRSRCRRGEPGEVRPGQHDL